MCSQVFGRSQSLPGAEALLAKPIDKQHTDTVINFLIRIACQVVYALHLSREGKVTPPHPNRGRGLLALGHFSGRGGGGEQGLKTPIGTANAYFCFLGFSCARCS